MNRSPPSSPSTSYSLLMRAREGEATSWQRLVQLYGPLVYSWARRGGLNTHDAADVTLETFAAVAMQLGRFDANRPGATFRGWLRTIARNKAIDLLRVHGNQSPPPGGTANLRRLAVLEESPSAGLSDCTSNEDERREQNQVVARAMAIMRSNFDKSTWHAFWRTSVDGCTPESVAEELGMSRWAVYKARSRVLHRLRSELGGLEELP